MSQVPNCINIGIGEYYVSSNPTILNTGGIGSCIVIIFHDEIKKIGGLAHTILPHAPHEDEKKGKYSDTAIPAMLNDFNSHGCEKRNITAKIIGGAHMFSALDTEGIGKQHANATLKLLHDSNIVVIATLTGGSAGRTVSFNIGSGLVRVTTTI